jgi:hypothetical protein
MTSEPTICDCAILNDIGYACAVGERDRVGDHPDFSHDR